MLDLATETFALPIWAAALIAASFAASVALIFSKPSTNGVLAMSARTGVVFMATVLIVWILLERTALTQREAKQRELDARQSELAMRAVAPGSPLACLDAIAGDAVESACEHALFASPQATAAAISYTAARLDLLAQSLAFANIRDSNYAPALLELRQGLESDRFGFVAQVLSLRDSCTPTQCDTFALLNDASRVQANLKERAFDAYVARYASNWSAADGHLAMPSPEAQLAATTSNSATTSSIAPTSAVSTSPSAAPPLRPIGALSHYDFPSASSIPPVSIMTPEPDGPPSSATTASAPTPQRRPSARAAAAPARSSGSTSPQPAASDQGHASQ
jgi:hypothetical protein